MGQITYADKSAINENAGVAATNKVQAADMNEIKSVVNANDSAFTSATTYSTNEVDTGLKWIDGKTIYRKVITGSGAGTVSISSLNVDKVFIDMAHSYIHWGRYTPIQLTTTSATNPGSYMAGVYINSSKTSLTLEAGSNVNVTDYIITLEYTKAS